MPNSLDPSTKHNYNQAFTQFINFCHKHNLRAMPIHEQNLLLYTTHLFNLSQYSSIKVHLSTINCYGIFFSYLTTIPPLPRIYLLTRAIKHKGTERKIQSPITVASLNVIYNNLHTDPAFTQTRFVWWTACLVAYFGLFQSAEFVAPTINTYLHIILTKSLKKWCSNVYTHT